MIGTETATETWFVEFVRIPSQQRIAFEEIVGLQNID